MQGLIENGMNFYLGSNNIFFIFFSVENSKTKKKYVSRWEYVQTFCCYGHVPHNNDKL